MLRSVVLSNISIRGIATTTFQGPICQMRKNPFPEVHVAHEIHGIIQWVPPEKLKFWEPQRTCDLRPLAKIDPNWLKLEYRPFADKIENLPEYHKKLFTVALANRRAGVDVIMETTLSKIRRHKYDSTSLEVTIAVFTIKIRNYQYILMEKKEKTSGFQRIYLKNIIDRRKKLLTQMRLYDYKRFEWIIQVLGILYKQNPISYPRIKRKECFTKLTDMYCEEIIQKKMEFYKAELEGQKVPFLQEKLETLNKIKEDEESMKIPCSVQEEIDITTRRLAELMKASESNKTLDITSPPRELESGVRTN